MISSRASVWRFLGEATHLGKERSAGLVFCARPAAPGELLPSCASQTGGASTSAVTPLRIITGSTARCHLDTELPRSSHSYGAANSPSSLAAPPTMQSGGADKR
jgi:hypothetical protein